MRPCAHSKLPVDHSRRSAEQCEIHRSRFVSTRHLSLPVVSRLRTSAHKMLLTSYVCNRREGLEALMESPGALSPTTTIFLPSGSCPNGLMPRPIRRAFHCKVWRDATILIDTHDLWKASSNFGIFAHPRKLPDQMEGHKE